MPKIKESINDIRGGQKFVRRRYYMSASILLYSTSLYSSRISRMQFSSCIYSTFLPSWNVPWMSGIRFFARNSSQYEKLGSLHSGHLLLCSHATQVTNCKNEEHSPCWKKRWAIPKSAWTKSRHLKIQGPLSYSRCTAHLAHFGAVGSSLQ